MYNLEDKYGRLTPTGHFEKRCKQGYKRKRYRIFIECVCDCGNLVWTEWQSLKRQTRSCGCLRSENCIKHLKQLSLKNIGTGNQTICDVCGEKFKRSLKKSKQNKFNYCSRKCMGKHYGQIKSGKNHPLYKVDRTKVQSKGRQHPSYKIWRNKVYKRDNWTCKCCGDKPKKLNAHHIKSFARFPQLQFQVDNGITLCIKCHKKFHKLYGMQKFTSDDFYEFKKSKEVAL